MILAVLSGPVVVTIAVVAFFMLLVIAVIVRGLVRGEGKPWAWRRYRVGVYIERDVEEKRTDERAPES